MKRLLLFALALVAAADTPKRGFRLEDRLPETTLAFVEIPDSPAFRDAFRGGRLHALFQDPDFKRFFEPAWSALVREYEELAREFEKSVGIPWEKAWDLADGQTAVALLSTKSGPDVVFSMDCTGQRATLLKGIEFLRGRVQNTEVWSVAGCEVVSGRIAGDVEFHVTAFGDALVAATKQTTIASVLQGGGGLTKSERFQLAREKAPVKNGVFVYANLGALPGELENRVDPQMVEALGLQSFTYAAGSVVPEGKRVTETFHVGVAGEKRGLAKLLSLKGEAHGLDLAPADVSHYLSLSIDLEELWSTTIEAIEAIDLDLLRQVRQFEREAGISIAKDLLPCFGPRITGTVLYPKDGLIPDGVTRYEIRDAAKLDQVLRTIGKNLQGEWASFEHDGVKIEYFRPHASREEMVVFLVSTVYFVRTETHLYATGAASLLAPTGTGSPNALKRLFARKNGATLADDAELRGWTTEGASLVWYADFARGFLPLYNTAAPMTLMFRDAVRELKLGPDLLDLPMGETIAKALSRAVVSVTAGKDGLSIRSVSGSGLTLLTAGLGGAGLVLAYPVLRQMEIRERTRQCQSNQYMLHYALYRYRSENGNKAPEKTGPELWKELADGGYASEEYLKCAHSGKPYRGPKTDPNKLGDGDPLCACEPGSHPDGRIHVLLAEGWVREVGADDPLYDQAIRGTR